MAFLATCAGLRCSELRLLQGLHFARAGWILVSTPLLLGLALPIYLLARPQLTVAQAHSSNLALALQTQLLDEAECPGCGSICEREVDSRC